ncbi:hypothetical protein RJ641_028259, partial [Dillenia turbinata]
TGENVSSADSTLSAVVTLESIEIYKTHEWLKSTPTVYFKCKAENETILPDVGKANVLYTFKGEESWQPLTDLADKKCKRCGIYEKDTFKSDDTFDEWEFCPSDFSSPDGRYTHFKDKELNATFLCAQCVPVESNTNQASPQDKGKGMHIVIVIVISALVSTVFVVGLIAGYKYWLKKKREHEQARFLKLFEDGDDIEDELGLGSPI